MKLTHKVTRELRPTTPFNFDASFHKPAHFQTGDNIWEPGMRWQTFWWHDKNLGVTFKSLDQTVSMEIYSEEKLGPDFIDGFAEEICYRYCLDLDLSEFYKKFSKDKFVGKAIKNLLGMRPGHENSLYEYLIIGIVLQNCTVRRSITMMQTLFEHYGILLEYDGKKLWSFWKPGGLKNVSEDELRSFKIGYRAKFIKRIDDYFNDGLINESDLRGKDLEIQKTELLKLYGVGPATVWYLLFDVFHQYDFFNHISPWEQKIYSKIFSVPGDELIKYFDRFGRYRQLAVHYVWEDLWWQHKKKPILWLAKEVRV